MIPAMFPPATIVVEAPRGKTHTVESLCHQAGIECRVTGPSASRVVYLHRAGHLEVHREPGNAGAVSIGLPGDLPEDETREAAFLVLAVLAYVVFDYAARESVRGRPEMRVSLPRGRPQSLNPMTGAERQRRWREKQARRTT